MPSKAIHTEKSGRSYVYFAIETDRYPEAAYEAERADVVVCEAFVGNVILKLYEGVGATLIKKVKGGMMTNLRSKIGALLVKPALKQTLKAFDLEEYGGAPLLGLKGLVVKTHGSSKSVEIKNTILQCITFQEQDVVGKITASIAAAKEEG